MGNLTLSYWFNFTQLPPYFIGRKHKIAILTHSMICRLYDL